MTSNIMAKKIKVMHIINNLGVGGAEKYLTLLLSTLAKRDDIELYLVLLQGQGVLIKELPENVHVRKFNFNIFYPVLNRLDPHARLALLRYVKQIKPDIIHGHLYKGEDFTKVLGALTKIPVITTSHDMLIWPGRKERFFNRYLTEAVAISEAVAKHLKDVYKLSPSKIKVIPGAIDSKLFRNSDKIFNKEKPVFIYIGRLLESKGIEDAIRGLALLRSDYPKLRFLVYGKETEKGYRAKLEKLVSDNGWDFVKFMGITNDVPAALKQGDISILASRSEGYAISVLEAATAGKPVIATRAGAIPDIVEDGKSGILVDWNSPDQIFKAAKKLLDENLVVKFGKYATKKANQCYDINTVADMYYDLYRSVIRGNKN